MESAIGAASTGGYGANNINANKLSLGTVGHFYDQVAVNVGSAASGNKRLAVYDTQTSVPTNLMAETGSIAQANNFAYHALTEFELTTTQNWAAYLASVTDVFVFFITGSSGDRYTKAHTFGAFPNPLTSPTSSNSPINMKIGHT